MPKGKKDMKSKRMYKVKLKPSREIDKFKACLAIKGYNQIERIDYKDSFLPVAKMEIV